MSQVFFILLGWALGLLSPVFADSLKSYFRSREFVAALRVELEDLQYRTAISSLSLIQSHGELDKEFAAWVLKIVKDYSGYEPSEGIRKFLEMFLAADEGTRSQINAHARADDGVGANLKAFQAKFLEANLAELLKLPLKTQRKIQELRNQLSILNQDVSRSDTYLMMTFNSSLSEDNHLRVTKDLKNLYGLVQRRCKSIAERIAEILSEL